MPFCAYCGNQVAAVSYAACPRCGNPTNGAPRPAAGKSSNATILIVVIVGGFVLVAVIGMIAAIAIPNFLTATQRAKQRRSMVDVRTIATAIEAYASDNNQYPNASSIEALRPLLEPKYIKQVPVRDGWGHAFEYECLTDSTGKCTGYVLRSRGKDGLAEGSSIREAVSESPRVTQNFDCDIVFSNGNFVEYPGSAKPEGGR
jgi:type II secretory pathway pseudopilin PulG